MACIVMATLRGAWHTAWQCTCPCACPHTCGPRSRTKARGSRFFFFGGGDAGPRGQPGRPMEDPRQDRRRVAARVRPRVGLLGGRLALLRHRLQPSANIVLAHIVLAYIMMAYIVPACVVLACVVLAYVLVLAHVVMAYIVMAYVAMALLRHRLQPSARVHQRHISHGILVMAY